jgi:hypothetical protein
MRKERSRPATSSNPDFDICRFRWQAARVEGGQLAFISFLHKFFAMPERVQKPTDPAPWGPKQGDEGGPRPPDISRPDTKDLLKKMRKVDPNQSKRYRQRTGQ